MHEQCKVQCGYVFFVTDVCRHLLEVQMCRLGPVADLVAAVDADRLVERRHHLIVALYHQNVGELAFLLFQREREKG